MRAFIRLYSLRANIQANLKTNPVEDNLASKEFRIKLNGDFATVDYKKIDDNTYDLIHSNIPKLYQGQGLGTILAERVFDHLVQKNIKMKVTCEYLQKFFNSNKDKYKNYVKN